MLTDRRVLFVRADGERLTDHTVAMARKLIEKLGIELRVKALYSKTPMHGNIYDDHYFERRR